MKNGRMTRTRIIASSTIVQSPTEQQDQEKVLFSFAPTAQEERGSLSISPAKTAIVRRNKAFTPTAGTYQQGATLAQSTFIENANKNQGQGWATDGSFIDQAKRQPKISRPRVGGIVKNRALADKTFSRYDEKRQMGLYSLDVKEHEQEQSMLEQFNSPGLILLQDPKDQTPVRKLFRSKKPPKKKGLQLPLITRQSPTKSNRIQDSTKNKIQSDSRRHTLNAEHDDHSFGEQTESTYEELGSTNPKKRPLANFLSADQPQKRLGYNYERASFADLYRGIPKQLYLRSEENIRHFCYRCHKINPLFRKLQYLSVVEFIKHSNIAVYERNQFIWTRTSPALCTYIVLWGRLQILDQQFEPETTVGVGDTLNQEHFLEGEKLPTRANYTVKCLENSGVLEMTRKSLNAIKDQLVQLYLKGDLYILQNHLKKNYLSKRNQALTRRRL